MKFDVYKDKDDKVLVYKQGSVSDCGELPEGKPLYESTTDGDWRDWCDARSDWKDRDRIRVCELVGTFPAKFVNDLNERAQALLDRYIAEGKEAGWGELGFNFDDVSRTYRRSANWKDEPTYYTVDQPLKWTNKKDEPITGFPLRVRDNLVRLLGMADGVYELGVSIVFDEQFKIHVFGVDEKWVTSFDE